MRDERARLEERPDEKGPVMAFWEFPTDGPIDLEIRLPAGSITIAAEPTQAATVTVTPKRSSGHRDADIAERVRVSFDHGRLSVIVPDRLRLRGSGSLDLEVRVPSGSACEVEAASADIRCTGELASLTSRAASGDLFADVISGPAEVRTASGDVRFREVAGLLRVHSASGDVKVDRVGGEASVETASGDLWIEHAGSSLTAQTATGDVRIGAIAAGHGEITTVSGDIAVGVPTGVGVYLDLSAISGDVRSDLDPSEADGDADLTLLCRSVSGDVRVSRTAANRAR
jgi:hypothetical protein